MTKLDIVSVNCEYKFGGDTVEVVAMNEMKPNYWVYQMMNRHKEHRVTPLVEFIDSKGVWHVVALEDFIEQAVEV